MFAQIYEGEHDADSKEHSESNAKAAAEPNRKHRHITGRAVEKSTVCEEGWWSVWVEGQEAPRAIG